MNFNQQVDRKMEEYFNGFERYGLREDDGSITTLTPAEMRRFTAIQKPEDELFIGPAEDATAYYALQKNLSEAELSDHRAPDGQWKPGRMVLESPLNTYHVYVGHEEELSPAQRAFITNGKSEDHDNLWAPLKPGARIHHHDGEISASLPEIGKETENDKPYEGKEAYRITFQKSDEAPIATITTVDKALPDSEKESMVKQAAHDFIYRSVSQDESLRPMSVQIEKTNDLPEPQHKAMLKGLDTTRAL